MVGMVYVSISMDFHFPFYKTKITKFYKSFIIYQISKITDVRFWCSLFGMWSYDFGFWHLEWSFLCSLFQSSKVSMACVTEDATILFWESNDSSFLAKWTHNPINFCSIRHFSMMDRSSIIASSVNWIDSISNNKIKNRSHSLYFYVNFCIYVQYKNIKFVVMRRIHPICTVMWHPVTFSNAKLWFPIEIQNWVNKIVCVYDFNKYKC